MMKNVIIEKYKTANSKLILLDYDGTLVQYVSIPTKAIPSVEVLSVLKEIAAKEKTTLFVISGREHTDLERFLGEIPINLIAEHGAMIKVNGKWENKISGNGVWKLALLPIFNHIAAMCPKSFVETKQFSLSWHYRNVEPKSGDLYSRVLIHAINDIVRSYELKIIDGNKVVEVINNVSGKGVIVEALLNMQAYDFVLALGDDETDEDMFRVLADDKNALTIKVGEGHTIAKNRLQNVKEALALLKLISKCD